jgi:hypothetical protein
LEVAVSSQIAEKFNKNRKGLDLAVIGEAPPPKQAGHGPAMPTGPPQADDVSFWRYADLIDRRIVSSRADLHRKQRLHGFPRSIKFSRAQGAAALFRASDVRKWVADHLIEQP